MAILVGIIGGGVFEFGPENDDERVRWEIGKYGRQSSSRFATIALQVVYRGVTTVCFVSSTHGAGLTWRLWSEYDRTSLGTQAVHPSGTEDDPDHAV
jgi:hypothetical protein